MKSVWPYFLNLIIIVVIVLIFVGKNPFHKTTQVAQQTASSPTPSANVAAYLEIDKNGKVRVTKADHTDMKQCGIKPDSKNPHCKGLGGNHEVVTSSKMFNILTVKGSTCILVIGSDGQGYQVCY